MSILFYRCAVALILIGGFLQPLQAQSVGKSQPLYGIIVPLAEESQWLQKQISEPKKINRAGISYLMGYIKNKHVILALSGLGKVNSALITTRMITDFHPSKIYMSGSAGNLNSKLKPGDVVVGETVVNVDLGELTDQGLDFKYPAALINPQTQQTLPLFFKSDVQKINLKSIPSDTKHKVILGKIATSDALPNLPPQVGVLQKNHVDVIEMEGASLMQVCWFFKTPCMVIRGISNDVADPITLSDTMHAGDNAAEVLVKIME